MPTSSTVFIPNLMNNLAGARFKVISGFNGANETGRAFDAAVPVPQFLDEATKAGLEFKPMSGEALQGLVSEVTTFPKDIIVKAQSAREGPK